MPVLRTMMVKCLINLLRIQRLKLLLNKLVCLFYIYLGGHLGFRPSWKHWFFGNVKKKLTTSIEDRNEIGFNKPFKHCNLLFQVKLINNIQASDKLLNICFMFITFIAVVIILKCANTRPYYIVYWGHIFPLYGTHNY